MTLESTEELAVEHSWPCSMAVYKKCQICKKHQKTMRIWNERYSKVIKIELNDDKWTAYHCLLSLLSRQISEPRLGLGLASPLKTLCLKGIGLQRRQRVAKAFSVAPWRVCFFLSRHRSPTAASRWRHGTTMTSGSFHWALCQISQIRASQNTNFQTHSSPSTWIVNSTATNDKNLWVGACHNAN